VSASGSPEDMVDALTRSLAERTGRSMDECSATT
jgi:hypothetical protein